MSSRTENPALAEMDRYLDQVALEEARHEAIQERAHTMLTRPAEVAAMLELRDDETFLLPLANLIVAALSFDGSIDNYIELTRISDEASKALFADATTPRHRGPCPAEVLLDAEGD